MPGCKSPWEAKEHLEKLKELINKTYEKKAG